MNKIILLLFISTLIFSCKQKSDKTKVDKPVKSINNFIGNWKSVDRGYPFSGYLSIIKDSTFKYRFGACIMSGFSEGSWRITDSIISLNSYDTDSCMFLYYFSPNCEVIKITDDLSDLNDEPDSDSSYMPKTTIKGCKPKGIDSYVKFGNEEFYIVGDTLKYIYKGENICQINYSFIRIKSRTKKP